MAAPASVSSKRIDGGRIRQSIAPGALREVLGVSYQEFTALHRDVALTNGGVASGWIDAYDVDDASVLIGYEHPHHGAWAAVTEHAFGEGIATAVGTLLDRATMASVLDRAAAPRRAAPRGWPWPPGW